MVTKPGFSCLLQIWPQDKFPLRKVGKMVLDQNIDNFHNESEQIAFNPGTVVPGLETSLYCAASADERACPSAGHN